MAGYRVVRDNELYHYGVKGMKWGVRRFQNKNGSYTTAGKKRYSNNGKGTFDELKKIKQMPILTPHLGEMANLLHITISDLKDGSITTAEKIHPKEPLTVETGSSVIYTIRVYNEGEIDGKVTEITDYLPDGLSLAENSSINTQYGWIEGSNGAVTTD